MSNKILNPVSLLASESFDKKTVQERAKAMEFDSPVHAVAMSNVLKYLSKAIEDKWKSKVPSDGGFWRGIKVQVVETTSRTAIPNATMERQQSKINALQAKLKEAQDTYKAMAGRQIEKGRYEEKTTEQIRCTW